MYLIKSLITRGQVCSIWECPVVISMVTPLTFNDTAKPPDYIIIAVHIGQCL